MGGKQMKLLLLASAAISSLVFHALATPLPWAIEEVSLRGPFLGLVSAYDSKQAEAFLKTCAFKPDSKHPYVDLSGRRFHIGSIGSNSVVHVRCGDGLVNAAAATQQLLDVFPVRGVIHFGTSGNADSSLSIGDVVIPTQFSQTGVWQWMKPKAATLPDDGVAELEFERFHIPGGGYSLLGRAAYLKEYFFSKTGQPDTAERKLWFETSKDWLQIASTLKVDLNQCVNKKACLPRKPKLVLGVNGTTANFFVDNPAYRDFLHKTFYVSSIDMESAAVVMTCLSNGHNVIAIRGLSNLAGSEQGKDSGSTYEPLAAANVAKTVVAFINKLPSPR